LLLHLIKREEVDIYDIPIARITDSYLQYVRALQALDLEEIGEFLVMAATLLQIKSRMLLPHPPREGEESEEEEDPRAELVRMLLEHQQYQEAARRLMEFQEARRRIFTRPSTNGERKMLSPSGRCIRFGNGPPLPTTWR
jgi:segregation and condensation protein A